MAQRGKGGGSTPRLRPDGRWQASFYDRAGKRRYVYGKTRRECQTKLREGLARRDAGYIDDRATVGGWIDRWLATLGPPRYRPASIRDAHYRLGLVPGWVRRLPLWELDPLDVERMFAELLETHSSSTVNGVRSLLKRCLGQAEAYGRAPRNAAQLTNSIRVVEKKVVPLTLVEARQLLGALADDRLYSLYVVALSCGLRQSEAIGLKWDKVDLEGSGTLRVDVQLTPYGEGPPKTKGSARTVPLPGVCVTALDRWRRRQLEERLRLGAAYLDGGFVWSDEAGRPLEHRSLYRHLQAACDRAGVRRCRFHELRHSAATLLLAQGVPPRTIMATLGHTDSKMLVRYAHVTDELAREAADAMDRAFGGRNGGQQGI